MSRPRLGLIAGGVGLALAGMAVATRGAGFSAQRPAWPGEATVAQVMRSWTLPRPYRTMTNPVAPSPETLRNGMTHWAEHCATCHDNDGSGAVTMGRRLFPPAPDMREAATQQKSDGALFYAIEHGVPFTGMPAFSNGTAHGERESWELVLFIRHLPRLTAGELTEMARMNPRTETEEQRDRDINDFLSGQPPAK